MLMTDIKHVTLLFLCKRYVK